MSILSDFSTLRSLQGPILVTGHTGFKGAWLVELLENLGFEVIGLSLEPDEGSLRQRIASARKYQEFFVDINDAEEVKCVFETVKPSFVFHLAAQAIVSVAFKNPSPTFLTNIVGTLNVIEAAKNLDGCKGVQVITTDKVYQNDNSGKSFTESDSLFAYDPYSGSKVATEAIVAGLQSLYKERHGLLIQSVRAGNVIGGGDYAVDRLIPDIVRSMQNEHALRVRNPSSTRPWQHVLEPLIGYLLAAENLVLNGQMDSYNFGPLDKSLPVSRVIEISKGIWPDLQVDYEEVNAQKMYEALALQISPSKAINQLGWKPIFSQETAVELTINWWEKVLKGKCSPLEAMKADIDLSLLSLSHD